MVCGQAPKQLFVLLGIYFPSYCLLEEPTSQVYNFFLSNNKAGLRCSHIHRGHLILILNQCIKKKQKPSNTMRYFSTATQVCENSAHQCLGGSVTH